MNSKTQLLMLQKVARLEQENKRFKYGQLCGRSKRPIPPPMTFVVADKFLKEKGLI